MYQLKLGSSVSYYTQLGLREEFFSDLKEMKKWGFYSIDFTLDNVGGYKNSMEKATMTIADGLKAIQDEGLHLNAVHLPFGKFCNISSCDEEIRQWCVNEYRQMIEVCDEFAPDHYIFHGAAGSDIPGVTEARRPALIKTFNELVSMTKARVCLENMTIRVPNHSDDAKAILAQVKGGWFCLDTNHVLREKVEDAILNLGGVISTLHISDHDYVQERHMLPKEGKIDWMKVIGALETIGYNGVFNYEPWWPKYPYTFEMLRKNYDMLFEEYNKR